MHQEHQRAVTLCPLGRRLMVGLRALGFDHMEADAVRVDLQVTPRTVNAYNRRTRPGLHGAAGYQPDGSEGSAGRGASGDLSCPGVSASLVSFTDSIVCRGPRMRRTLR